jgi:hypothetical protein
MKRCWEALPSDRPPFTDIIAELEDIQVQAQVRSQTLIVAFKRILRIAQKIKTPNLAGPENVTLTHSSCCCREHQGSRARNRRMVTVTTKD